MNGYPNQNPFRRKAHNNHFEDQYQIAVVHYLRVKYPDVLFTISPIVHLSHFMAKRIKALGYMAGTPDILIFKPAGTYHGLMIEMKRPASMGVVKGTVSESQAVFNRKLNELGYKAAICYGSNEAIELIDEYLNFGV